MKPATIWYRRPRPSDQWEMNHLEDGHCANDVPTPKCELHEKVWKGGGWEKYFVWLDDNNVVHHGVDE